MCLCSRGSFSFNTDRVGIDLEKTLNLTFVLDHSWNFIKLIFPGIVLELIKNVIENENLSLNFLKLQDFLEKISRQYDIPGLKNKINELLFS